jgi:hypothetical protein
MEEIKTDEICCPIFKDFAAAWKWFSVGDENHLVLPNVLGIDGKSEWKVNYCPSCGAKIVGKIFKRSDLVG